mgnify:CR=1 FL=1
MSSASFPLDELASGGSRKVDVDGVSVCVVRIDDDVYAIGDTCSHAEVSLSEGEVSADDRSIECWKHGSRFDLTTGVPDCLPATQSVPVFVAHVVDGQVVIDVETSGGPT